MKAVYSRPKYLRPMLTYYCAGCQHGIVSKLLTELAEEMDIAGNLAVCYGIGCYVAGLMNVDLDMFPALHGRGCAVATGFKRCRPEQLVIRGTATARQSVWAIPYRQQHAAKTSPPSW